MTNTILALLNQLNYLFTHITISNIIDMTLVAVVFFVAFQALYQTRALQILRGLIVMAVVGGGLLVLLPLNTLNWLVRFSLLAGLIALPILFQDELRRMLVGLGHFGRNIGEISDFERFTGSLISAVRELSAKHTGALIVLEGKTILEDVIETGVLMQVEVVSHELLQTIFSPKTPLHDGAVVFRGDRLMAAGCILPVETDDVGNSQLGTRHRAALGLSNKVADALVIVVSEETGWISVANNGRLYLNLSLEDLEQWLTRFGEQLKDTRKFRWEWLRGGGLRPSLVNLVTAIGLAVIAWVIVVYQTNPPDQTTIRGVPLMVNGPTENLMTTSKIPETITVQIQSTSDRIKSLSVASVQASIDLNSISAGLHSIPVKVETGDPFIQVINTNPKTIDVTLDEELTRPISPTIRIIDIANLPPGYVIGEVSSTPKTVQISGPKSKVEKVATARVDVSLGSRKNDFQETDTPELISSDGIAIDGLNLIPDQVVVTIPISQTFFTKQVGVQPEVDQSKLDRAYEVTQVNVDPPSVTLTGVRSALDEIGSFIDTVPISLTNQTMGYTTTTPLIIPNGISVLNDQGASIHSVQVQISIQAVSGYLVLNKQVRISNPPLTATITIDPIRVSILIIGSQILLDQLAKNPDLIILSVTLNETEPGTYTLPLEVQAPPELRVELFPKEVQITLK
jgi:diadenylate cyclase